MLNTPLPLPHGEDLLFAKKLINFDKDRIVVLCQFPQIPSFSMALEGAAQASAGFSEKQKEAFLAGATAIKRLKDFDKTTYQVSLACLYTADNMSLFSFEMEDYLQGKFAIHVR